MGTAAGVAPRCGIPPAGDAERIPACPHASGTSCRGSPISVGIMETPTVFALHEPKLVRHKGFPENFQKV